MDQEEHRQEQDPDAAYDDWRDREPGEWWAMIGRNASFFNEAQALKLGKPEEANRIVAQREKNDREYLTPLEIRAMDLARLSPASVLR